jgi:t-SNARE complex subunit (syntaxin)
LPPPWPVQFELVNGPTNPDDPPRPSGEESISASAERARAQLHEEIERVRRGVEQMLDEQQAPLNSDIRRELDTMQEDLRRYVKTRVRKAQKRTDRQIRRLDDRTTTLEQRLDSMDAERRLTEWRIHSDTERMLDGLLGEVRAIADRLEGTSYG